MGRVTLKTVAERVGVSPMTVSNAFSRPDQLSAAPRRECVDAAAELGYVGPDPAARTLAKGSTGTVGILLTKTLRYAFTDEFSAVFLASIAEGLAEAGLALTLLPPEGTGDVVPARDVAMDAAIVYSCGLDAEGLDWLRRRRLPLVQVDQPPDPKMTSINIEDRSGAFAVAEHVVQLGHRRVALLVIETEDADVDEAGSHQENRMLGWLDALTPAGIEPVVVRCEISTEESAFAAARGLFDAPDRPTAVLCFSDAAAAGALRAARAAGLDVPADVTIVGFDDSPLARRADPPLTTVRQDAERKGQITASAIVEALERKRAGRPQRVEHIMLPTELVVRESSGPPPR